MCLGSETGSDGERNQHCVVARNDRPGCQQDDNPRDQRQVRVPRLGKYREPVATDKERHDQRHNNRAAPPRSTVSNPERESDPQRLHECRRRFHRPRRTAEQPVSRRKQPEVERTGVAALIGKLADAAGQANQRGLPRSDIADAELGHCEVEYGIPPALCERDDRDQQRDAKPHGDQHDEASAASGKPPGACGEVIHRQLRPTSRLNRSPMPQRVTSSIDSTMIRPDILDFPRVRSRKIIGVSTTLAPSRVIRRTSSVRNA